MPRKTKDGQPFDQNAYIEQWKKENMTCLSVRYKKEFVQEFKASCAKLDLKQSDVFRNAMQAVINQANEQEQHKKIGISYKGCPFFSCLDDLIFSV